MSFRPPAPAGPAHAAVPPMTLSVTTEIRDAGISGAEATEHFSLPVPVPLTPGVPHAEVAVMWEDSRCVDYNTTRVRVSVSMPCDPTESAVREAESWASRLVKEFVEREKSLVGGSFHMVRTATPPPPSTPPPPTHRAALPPHPELPGMARPQVLTPPAIPAVPFQVPPILQNFPTFDPHAPHA